MKTKHLFFIFFFSLIAIGCSTDDAIEETVTEETLTLEPNDFKEIRADGSGKFIVEPDDPEGGQGSGGSSGNNNNNNNNSACNYSFEMHVYYKSIPSRYSSRRSALYIAISENIARSIRTRAINSEKFNPTNYKNCKKYSIPENPVFLYDSVKKQYYEEWGIRQDGKPRNRKHDIEL